jgi:glycosyltransferase involved in cell wall biosynthesis
MEAMASGLPCIASNIRGNSDLLNDRNGGLLCNELSEYVEAIQQLAANVDLRIEMGAKNIENIQQFSLENATEEVQNIYKNEICVCGG